MNLQVEDLNPSFGNAWRILILETMIRILFYVNTATGSRKDIRIWILHTCDPNPFGQNFQMKLGIWILESWIQILKSAGGLKCKSKRLFTPNLIISFLSQWLIDFLTTFIDGLGINTTKNFEECCLNILRDLKSFKRIFSLLNLLSYQFLILSESL